MTFRFFRRQQPDERINEPVRGPGISESHHAAFSEIVVRARLLFGTAVETGSVTVGAGRLPWLTVGGLCIVGEQWIVIDIKRHTDLLHPLRLELDWEDGVKEAIAVLEAYQAREESGLDVLPSTLTLIDRFVETSAVLDFYVVRATSNAEVTLQQSEVVAAEWVPPAEVLRRLNAGAMADPWIARLDSLWPSTALALSIVP